ncbi:AAA family ATPase [Corynebacterium glyciniphilum]|uniref:AAA family ATPase n=1 Tax=Corynebacterium glyciniphilum TaxID=1404244 RepID=UPI003FCFA201
MSESIVPPAVRRKMNKAARGGQFQQDLGKLGLKPLQDGDRRLLVDRAGNTVAEAVDGLPDTYQFIRDTRIRTQRATVTIGRYDTVDAVHAVALFAGTDDAAVVAATLDQERQQAERKSKAAQDKANEDAVRRMNADEFARREKARRLYGDVGEVVAVTGDAVVEVVDDDETFLIPGMWSFNRPQVLAYGEPKVGKSTLAHNFVAALLSGEMLFGHRKVVSPGGRVGLIDTEMTRSYLTTEFGKDWPEVSDNRDRLILYPLGEKGAARLFDVTDPEVRNEWVDRLRDAHVEVLFIDCLGPLLRKAGVDENTEAGMFMEHIREVCDRAGVKAHMILDHASAKTSKGTGTADKTPRGDSRKLDTVDTIMHLYAHPDVETGLQLKVTGRDGDRMIDLDRDGKRFTEVVYSGGDDYRQAREAFELYPAVKRVLTDVTEPLSQRGLVDAVFERVKGRSNPPSERQVKACVGWLVAQGHLATSSGPNNRLLHSLTDSEPVAPTRPPARVRGGTFGGISDSDSG